MQASPTEIPPAPLDASAFKRAMGSFASGVTVVTAVRDGQVHGITVSAFVSVSLDPPLVLVSIGNRANAHGVLRTTDRFAVSVLAADQQAVSDHFAWRKVEGLAPLEDDPEGVPTVAGALAVVQCVLHDAVEAGDHTLFLGRVVAARTRDDGAPLVYWRGRYRGVTEAG